MSPPVDVLIIEDAHELRFVLLQVLKEEGYRATGTDNGSDGLRLIRELRPRLVLCDIRLPDTDGFAIWRESSKACRRWGTIFVLTSANLPAGQQPRGTTFLSKPFELDHLLALVERTLRRDQVRAPNDSHGTPQKGRRTRTAPALRTK